MNTSKDNCNLADNVQAKVSKEQLSPLENPVIVDAIAYQICHHGTTDDIKSFRLVNKLWESAIPEPWKSAIRIHRIYQNTNSVKPDEEDAITLTQLRDLPDTNVICKGIIELQSWKLEENLFLVPTLNQLEPTLDNWFWNEYGSNISSLALNNCATLGAFTIYSEAFLKALPNLKTLRVINSEISALGWDTMHERYCNKREFLEHFNLRNLYLDIVASDEQFNYLWSPFQRSLPNLDHVSIKRLNRKEPSYKWAIPLLRYWQDTATMKTLSFSEFSEIVNDELYQLNISRSKNEASRLKVDWRVNQQCSPEENLTAFPNFPCLKPRIAELNLSGQVFRNLCFLQGLKNLKVLIWKGSDDKRNSRPPLYDITTLCKSMNCISPKLATVHINSSVTIGDCSCPPVSITTAEEAFEVVERMGFDSGRWNVLG